MRFLFALPVAVAQNVPINKIVLSYSFGRWSWSGKGFKQRIPSELAIGQEIAWSKFRAVLSVQRCLSYLVLSSNCRDIVQTSMKLKNKNQENKELSLSSERSLP